MIIEAGNNVKNVSLSPPVALPLIYTNPTAQRIQDTNGLPYFHYIFGLHVKNSNNFVVHRHFTIMVRYMNGMVYPATQWDVAAGVENTDVDVPSLNDTPAYWGFNKAIAENVTSGIGVIKLWLIDDQGTVSPAWGLPPQDPNANTGD
jgi:hypothetical protein